MWGTFECKCVWSTARLLEGRSAQLQLHAWVLIFLLLEDKRDLGTVLMDVDEVELRLKDFDVALMQKSVA